MATASASSARRGRSWAQGSGYSDPSLDDWISRQASLVTQKRRVLDVVMQRNAIAEGLAKHLDRLGLERRKPEVDLAQVLASLHGEPEPPVPPSEPPAA